MAAASTFDPPTSKVDVLREDFAPGFDASCTTKIITRTATITPRTAVTTRVVPRGRLPGFWYAVGTCVVFRAVQRPYRVIVAKPGLDGHDRGAKVIARALRDSGFEVIYTGLHQTPEQVVETVVQEDADAVGLSLLSGAHMTLFPRIVELLGERGAEDVLVFGGGIIPEADIPKLKQAGVAEIFTPGATMASITEWLEKTLDERESQTQSEGTR